MENFLIFGFGLLVGFLVCSALVGMLCLIPRATLDRETVGDPEEESPHGPVKPVSPGL